jgi:hypothetical protein
MVNFNKINLFQKISIFIYLIFISAICLFFVPIKQKSGKHYHYYYDILWQSNGDIDTTRLFIILIPLTLIFLFIFFNLSKLKVENERKLIRRELIYLVFVCVTPFLTNMYLLNQNKKSWDMESNLKEEIKLLNQKIKKSNSLFDKEKRKKKLRNYFYKVHIKEINKIKITNEDALKANYENSKIDKKIQYPNSNHTINENIIREYLKKQKSSSKNRNIDYEDTRKYLNTDLEPIEDPFDPFNIAVEEGQNKRENESEKFKKNITLFKESDEDKYIRTTYWNELINIINSNKIDSFYLSFNHFILPKSISSTNGFKKFIIENTSTEDDISVLYNLKSDNKIYYKEIDELESSIKSLKYYGNRLEYSFIAFLIAFSLIYIVRVLFFLLMPKKSNS